MQDIWGCELIEQENEEGIREIAEIGYTIDNTTKTRALFEINKGTNINSKINVNSKLTNEQRRVDFRNMIYIADGPSDVHAFSVVKGRGGATFAIYPKGNKEAFNELGIKPKIIYGVGKQSDLVLIEELEKLGDLIICSDSGEVGYHGNVVSYLKEHSVDYDYYYACGPQVMCKYLKALTDKGCLSLEARMGCGFGACMGCSIETTNGPKRVCKEGPVFEASEVLL